MAATVTAGLTAITACDSQTADGTWGGSVSDVLATSDPTPIEGTGWIGGIIKKAGVTGNDMTFTPTASLNLSGQHLRWPMFTILKYNMYTQATGGCQLTLSDGTNTAAYYVSGSDVYVGGFELLTLDCDRTPDSGTQPTLTAITEIGIDFFLNVASKNIVTTGFDFISYGEGLVAYGGTSGDEITLADIDLQDVYYLIAELVGGVNRLRGPLVLGDSAGTGSCYFKDPGKQIMFDELLVADSLYHITVVSNATGTTDADFSGMFISSVANPWKFDSSDTDVDVCTLDGTTMQNARTSVTFGSTTSGVGTIIDACGLVTPGLADLSSLTVKNSTATSALALPATHNISSASFISAGTGYAITGFSVAGDYSLTDFNFTGYASSDGSTGNEAIYVEATTGTVNIAISGGNTPSVRTAGATVVVTNEVTVTINSNVSLVGAEIRIYDLNNTPAGSLGTELAGVESAPSSTYQFSETAANLVFIQVQLSGYVEFGQEYTVPTVNSTFTATLKPETNL